MQVDDRGGGGTLAPDGLGSRDGLELGGNPRKERREAGACQVPAQRGRRRGVEVGDGLVAALEGDGKGRT